MLFVFFKEKKHKLLFSVPKIGIAILVYYVVLVLFSKFSLTFFVLLTFLPIIFVYLAQFFLILIKKRNFEVNFLRFLNFLILKMKTGSSFRDSVEKVCFNFDSNFNFTLKKIMQFVTFSQQTEQNINNKLIKIIVNEFKYADQTEHLAISRLENFYNSLKKTSDFRRRSGQISKQVQVQLVLIVVLYVAVLIAGAFWFSWESLENLYLISLFLFFIGVYMIFRIKRSFKWKT